MNPIGKYNKLKTEKSLTWKKKKNKKEKRIPKKARKKEDNANKCDIKQVQHEKCATVNGWSMKRVQIKACNIKG